MQAAVLKWVMTTHGARTFRIRRKDAAARTRGALLMGSRGLGVHDPGHTAHEQKSACCHGCWSMSCRLRFSRKSPKLRRRSFSSSREDAAARTSKSRSQMGSRGLGVNDPGHAVHEESRPAVMTAAVCSAGCSPHQLDWKSQALVVRIGRLDAAARLSESFPDGQQRACCARPCDAVHEGEAPHFHDCCSMPCRQLTSIEP